MSKVISVLMGLALMALGAWGCVAWWPDVLSFLKAGVVVMALLVGLGVLVFGLSELRPEETVRSTAPPTPPITDSPEGSA